MDRWAARLSAGVQLLKMALAAGLAWWLALLLFSRARPYFAPLAAILTMQVTVAKSVSLGGQRILGVVGGIAVSLTVAHWLGISALSIGMIVLVASALAALLGLGPNAVAQAAVTALLVVALGNGASYAAARLVDTILGALVAVLVNALLVPPDATPAAVAAVAELAELAGRHLARDPSVRRAPALLDQVGRAHAQVAAAAESLQFAPLLRRRRRRLLATRRAEAPLTRIAWRVQDWEDVRREEATGGAPARAHDLERPMAAVLYRYAAWLSHPAAERLAALEEAVRQLRRGWARPRAENAGAAESEVALRRIVPAVLALADSTRPALPRNALH